MPLLNAKNLTLEEVHRRLGFQRGYCDAFETLLPLEPLSDREQQEIQQTRREFEHHLISGDTSEGQVKQIAVSPLLRLAGFFQSPLQVVEEGIARIELVDEDTIITGRFDILAVHRTRFTDASTPF